MAPPLRPSHNLVMRPKGPGQKRSAVVGSGWMEADGRIAVRLHVGVALSWRDAEDCVLSLFPAAEEAAAEAAEAEDAPGEAAEGAPERCAKPCPKCGGVLRLRTGNDGEFWGCVQFPKCRGSRPLRAGGAG